MPVPRHVIERLERAGQEHRSVDAPGEHRLERRRTCWRSGSSASTWCSTKNPRYWDAAHVEALARAHADGREREHRRSTCTRPASSTRSATARCRRSSWITCSTSATSSATPYAGHVLLLGQREDAAARRRARAPGALSLAIDRESLVEYVTARAARSRAPTWCPTASAAIAGPHSPIFDPEQARRLLRRGRLWPGPPAARRSRCATTPPRATSRSPRPCSRCGSKHLGVAMSSSRTRNGRCSSRRSRRSDFQIARLGWVGDYPDPYTFLELLTQEQRQQPLELGERRIRRACSTQANRTQDRDAAHAAAARAPRRSPWPRRR